MSKNTYHTEQEAFWAGSFGDAYIDRNKSEQLLASNLNFFSTCLKHAGRIDSCIEFGANIGMNLKALQMLYPGIDMHGVEINENAARQLESIIDTSKIYNCSIIDAPIESTSDLSFIKGVLIHINPDHLNQVYEKLYAASKKFILVAEYYNPSPVAIPYRGHTDRLFKRDFAGEMLDRFTDLQLIDYGFAYHRDPAFPQDDITWFLLRKSNLT
jgi:pseudaminic acid biosynthesis-associated methylase